MKFMQIIEQKGFDSARELYVAIRSGRRGNQFFSENFLNHGVIDSDQKRFRKRLDFSAKRRRVS